MANRISRVEIDKTKANLLALNEGYRRCFRLALKVEEQAKVRVAEQATKTGALGASIRTKMTLNKASAKGQVGSPLKYAMVVHEGAKPHTIVARKRRGMKWLWPAGVGVPPLTHAKMVCFKGKVHHPGMRARRYLVVPLIQEAAELGFRVEVVAGTSRFQR